MEVTQAGHVHFTQPVIFHPSSITHPPLPFVSHNTENTCLHLVLHCSSSRTHNTSQPPSTCRSKIKHNNTSLGLIRRYVRTCHAAPNLIYLHLLLPPIQLYCHTSCHRSQSSCPI